MTDFPAEIGKNLLSLDGMHHFRMELNAVNRFFLILNAGKFGVVRGSKSSESFGNLHHFVAVRHPDLRGSGNAFKQRAFRNGFDFRLAVFTGFAARHIAAERKHGQLHSVADAENRQTQVENLRITFRRAVLIDTGGTAAENDARRGFFADFFRRCPERNDPAVHVAFPNPARNQLTVLRAEVKNQNCFCFCHNCKPYSMDLSASLTRFSFSCISAS